MSNTIAAIERTTTDSDPYQEQIDTLKDTGLQAVDWDELNRLTDIKDHQDFLLKLLNTNFEYSFAVLVTLLGSIICEVTTPINCFPSGSSKL